VDAERGRALFHKGRISGEPEIVAAIGPEAFEVSAEVMPCSSCHGRDGRGRPEGGVAPSNLTWPVLTRPASGQGGTQRPRPAYDSRSFIRAVTMGIDPGGKALSPTMPRYRLSRRDAADLTAYVRLLGSEDPPGVNDEELRVGILRAGGPARPVVEGVIEAYFRTLNDLGGVFGRRLTLVPVDVPEISDRETLRQALEAELVFALLASSIEGREESMALALQDLGLPLVGPFYRRAFEVEPPSRYVFYLYGGLDEQVRTLVEFASRRVADPAAAALLVVHDGSADFRAAAEVAQAQAQVAQAQALGQDRGPQGSASYGKVELLDVADPALAGALAGASQILWLAPAVRLRDQLEAGAQTSFGAEILIPGALLDPALFGLDLSLALFTAFPTLPADIDAAGGGLLEGLQAKMPPGSRLGSPEIAALASAVVVAAALRESGRKVDREAFVEALEGMRNFPTGLVPPLNFGPNRRLGVAGGHVLEVDARTGQMTALPGRVLPRH
jgi:mono/diheme cytochrome c family protein